MDTLERAAALYDANPDLQNAEPVPARGGGPLVQSINPFSRNPVPATLTQAPDSLNQFRVPALRQQRFFNSLPLTANLSAAPSQSQAQVWATSQSTALTLNDVADTALYKKVPIEQFDANGNLVVVNFQGAWNGTTVYTDGQEVSYNGNVWVATTTNVGSAPSNINPNWELVGPQTLDNVADGSTYARVVGNALTSGQPDLSKPGVINKTLDFIADTSNFSRILTNITTGNTLKSPHASAVAQVSPTHWYPFEGMSGNVPTTDIGTSPNNLSFVNISGTGSEFVGANSLVNGDSLLGGTLSNFAAQFTESSGYGAINYTVALWAYFNGSNPPSAAPLQSMYNGTAGSTPSSYEIGLYVRTTGEVVYVGQFTGGTVTIVSGALNWKVPHHIAYIVNGGGVTLLIDGQVAGTGAASGTHIALNNVIFGSLYNGAWIWNSNTTLQHITIWRGSALGVGQIQALYQAGATGAQSLDNLNDGVTWQRVTGVVGNQTSSSSYTIGSISNTYNINAGSCSFMPSTANEFILAQGTLLSSASNVIAISGYTNYSLSSGGPFTCFIDFIVGSSSGSPGSITLGGVVVASFLTTFGATPITFTCPTSYFAGSLSGQTFTMAFRPQSGVTATLNVGSSYITAANLKA